jgi:hypothetical protein
MPGATRPDSVVVLMMYYARAHRRACGVDVRQQFGGLRWERLGKRFSAAHSGNRNGDGR